MPGMSTEALWTLDELVRRVAAALAGAAYPGAPNGRVRDLPDRRVVRWYATIGLVDRPAAMHGRTALYGPRHLLQLVAVKRRQAQGRALAEIQAELTGATDPTLCRIAAVPAELLAAEPVGPPQPAVEPQPASVAGPASAAGRRARFWAEQRAAAPPAAAVADSVARVGSASAHAPAVADSVTTLIGTTLTGVPLPGGALLLLPVRPDPDDLPAIQAAVQPLLDLLADRGLLTRGDESPSPRRSAT